MAETISEARSFSRRMQEAQRAAAHDAHVQRLRAAQPGVEEAQRESTEPVPRGSLKTIRAGMGTVTRFGV